MSKLLPASTSLEILPSHADVADMRPTLLRVLTDLYLQRPTHTIEDERYYTELALRLIDAADAAQREALATRLARYPSAPRLVIERLARDVIEVATPILEHSPCLDPHGLKAIAEACGGAHAEIVSGRLAQLNAAPSPGNSDPATAAGVEASELSEAFYAASPAERRLILISLDYAMITPSPPLVAIRRTDVWRLELAALRHNADGVVRELERTFGITRQQALRIVNDDLGEPIVVVARAMNIPGDVLQRMLLFMNPCVGQSVDRVHALAGLFREVTCNAARRLMAIWRAAPIDDPTDEHETITRRIAVETVRHALAEVSRRPELQHDPHRRSGMR